MALGRARTLVLVTLAGIAEAEAGTCARAKLPGEYPERRFRSAFAAEVTGEKQELREKYLLGDWLGTRARLVKHGINLTVLFITDPFGNVLGGERLGFADYNLVGVDLVIDTDKLLGWCGGHFHVGLAGNFGDSLSRDSVGNTFPIQLADVADANVRLTYLSYTQSLFDGRLSVRAGRLTLNSVGGEEFLASEYFKAFTSVGIDLVPLGLFLNAPGAFGYPNATWGARIRVQPIKQLYVMAGVYNGDPNLKSGARHGVDFSFHGPPFLIVEVGARRNYGERAPGLSSNLKLGAYQDGGRNGLYLVGDQELVRWGPPAQHRHLGAFAAFVFAPARQGNTVPIFLDGGLVLYGPTRLRPKDFLGVAAVYGSYSADTGRDFEMTIEANYGLRLRPGLMLQPDLQYIIHPGGKTLIPNALAMGVNVVVNL
jgi:porin